MIGIERLTSTVLVELFNMPGQRLDKGGSSCERILDVSCVDAVMESQRSLNEPLIYDDVPAREAHWSLFRWALRLAVQSYSFTVVHFQWPSASRPGGTNELRVLLWEPKSAAPW